MILFTVVIHGRKSEYDEAHLKNNNVEDDVLLKSDVDAINYVTPDINSIVYFADNFDSDEAYEKKLIKSSAKRSSVKAANDR